MWSFQCKPVDHVSGEHLLLQIMAAALTVFQLMSVIPIYSEDIVKELGLEWNKND